MCSYLFSFWRRGLGSAIALMTILTITSFRANAQHYLQTNLVSDVPGLATTTDPNLVNAWA